MNILQQPRMDAIPFVGGLDLVSGAWNAAPGTLRRAQNYEIDINGERFAAKPHMRPPYDPDRMRVLA